MRDLEPWETSIERLYKEMYPALYAYAKRILDDPALAEEAIQDTFCIACAKQEQLLHSSEPRGWVMCTLKYVMRNMLRAQVKLKNLLCQIQSLEASAGDEVQVSVDVLFGDVSDSEDFQLLKRVALDRCTMLEIAEELDISVEACKKRVQRARKRLQERIEAQ
ncbi:MAG: sigma-70 family RNA polymerase sigma factor [Oscillibacter sp.]|nr:sigma-70 family RNA polymerase sigma factor [Oscillibacter sp.]MBD5155506.1 sigma-70 family RNA polymerase sigma factor [Oscillibacter sp.]